MSNRRTMYTFYFFDFKFAVRLMPGLYLGQCCSCDTRGYFIISGEFFFGSSFLPLLHTTSLVLAVCKKKKKAFWGIPIRFWRFHMGLKYQFTRTRMCKSICEGTNEIRCITHGIVSSVEKNRHIYGSFTSTSYIFMWSRVTQLECWITIIVC